MIIKTNNMHFYYDTSYVHLEHTHAVVVYSFHFCAWHLFSACFVGLATVNLLARYVPLLPKTLAVTLSSDLGSSFQKNKRRNITNKERKEKEKIIKNNGRKEKEGYPVCHRSLNSIRQRFISFPGNIRSFGVLRRHFAHAR